MAKVSEEKVTEIIVYLRKGKPETGILADVANLLTELLMYRSEIKAGRMIILPCAVGDMIYKIPSNANYGLNMLHRHQELNRIYPQVVSAVSKFNSEGYLLITCDGQDAVPSALYRETWFLSEKAAKKALRKLEVKWSQAYSKHPGGGK